VGSHFLASQQFRGSEGIQGMLELPSSGKRGGQTSVESNASGLIVHDFIGTVGQSIDPIDSPPESDRSLGTQWDVDRIGTAQRFPLRLHPESHLKSDCLAIGVLALKL
jgi:hypothetical protein